MSPKRPRRCPACRKPAAWEDNPFRPFCSERCKLLDLGGWATEAYRIPSAQAPEEAGGEPLDASETKDDEGKRR